MAGHSKWVQIKRKKAVTDAKRSKLFTKLVRYIIVEAKLARGDLGAPALRAAIEKARKANMPQDNIDRAVKKASEPSANMEAITYEAYGPGGAGIIVETLTDNKNRTAQEIKHILANHGTTLAGIGAVKWAFEKEGLEWKPHTLIPLGEEDLNKLESLIDELENNDDVQEVYTNAE